jgi:hypothetical protein
MNCPTIPATRERTGHQRREGHRVVATPILGGLPHEYRLESAA